MSLLRKRRIFYTLIGFMLIFVIFAARLAWIPWNSAHRAVTAAGRTINELAVRQREQSVDLDLGRGHITDRNGVPLTGFVRWKPTLFPVSELPAKDQLDLLAGQLGTSSGKLKSIWSGLKSPLIWEDYQGSRPVDFPKVQGFEVLPFTERYPQELRGNQWIGYIAQRPDIIRKLRAEGKSGYPPLSMLVGASGLEKTMDRFLRGTGGTRIAYSVDGKNKPMPETEIKVNGPSNRFYPLEIQTTVDQGIQRKLERLSAQADVKEGAIVVLDAKQGDVIAMVSRPFYDPNQVNPKDGDWSNQAVKAAVPGSIFKTVIAAAALEEKATYPGETFFCSGHYGKYGLSCWKKEGHGSLTLEEGYAKSCNTVFAALGERLSAQVISNAASRLGLSRKIGWSDDSFMGGESLRQMDQEEAGSIFSPGTNMDGGVLAQTAIGQRDVMVSPLQAANLVVTLLHGGRVSAPRLVSDIRYKDGSLFAHFPVQTVTSPFGRVSSRTSERLLTWMRGVVTDGTGRSLLQAMWPLAGKSGTAQVKQGTVHQWFIGYGPVNKPKYAVAVLVQNRPSSSEHQAAALFRETMNILADPSS